MVLPLQQGLRDNSYDLDLKIINNEKESAVCQAAGKMLAYVNSTIKWSTVAYCGYHFFEYSRNYYLGRELGMSAILCRDAAFAKSTFDYGIPLILLSGSFAFKLFEIMQNEDAKIYQNQANAFKKIKAEKYL